MKVKIIKDVDQLKQGEEVTVSDDVGKKLVKKGFAESSEMKVKPKTKE